ncbi:MAG: bifunctional DNA-formamidopyrimidine glycosylase/DNA-(apurinic or apyrimidinic site) lyase [Candidatus Moeniiplasma glomeromycotorum]|nr:bifunctional DNA-formamidopyrimidine glycosylase/DNA-(apurinic or apyrimidinic site) lyase [Candidatus Moeniiplasma glomeromycotorum]MCE8162212.1 bifunctional DNA-formamidopyrimidine glycosylase/DNA-(apurinic or apyrimidinic site) lyase [Candidatus Moeniiplasma glomeromycotorum]MCE8166132.1 bifunctional DNA-formamidopyrimidine glycosylase/DNA-(apurinic or apyrimidinic site) lyase [Candidatus Moeniiplasma glomeromycotorum]MCE8166611.1 bifunctional DNA-formamidopyrimidine glycosylase/DNA-(apuri
MPELPEVETVRQILRLETIGKTIQKIEIYKSEDETKKRVSLIKEMDEEDFIDSLKGKTIHEIERKGKWLFFILTNQEKIKSQVLISHLGMTGKYFVEEKLLTPEQKNLFKKHNSEGARVLTFYLSDAQGSIKLIHCDARRFGSLRLQKFEDYEKKEPYQNIGTDLLEETVDIDLLFKHYQKRKVPIKTALLEQNLISGIGNIYASEILFDTKIHPFKKTNQLTELEVKNIVASAQSILRKALKLGGTSEFDFVNPLSKEGSYQNSLKVYNRKGKPCYNCRNLIENLAENKLKKTKERSTFFCPQCQKI